MGHGGSTLPGFAPDWHVPLALTLAGALPHADHADDIDDILAKRQANWGRIKHMQAEVAVDTDRPAAADQPAKTIHMQFRYEITHRNRNDPNPRKRFDLDMTLTAPMPMRFRLLDGEIEIMSNSGEWMKKGFPVQAETFLKDLGDVQPGDPATQHAHYDIRRLKAKDNLWGEKGVRSEQSTILG